MEPTGNCTGTVYTSRIEIRVKVYQVRIGGSGSIQEQIYRLIAESLDAAEQSAVFGHDVAIHGPISYIAVSVA